jgi:hypothetical protein
MMKKKIKIGYADVDIQLIDKKLFPKWSTEHLGDYDANNAKNPEGRTLETI